MTNFLLGIATGVLLTWGVTHFALIKEKIDALRKKGP